MEERNSYTVMRYGTPEKEKVLYKNKMASICKDKLISAIQKQEIEKFAQSCLAEGITPKRVAKYLNYLSKFGIFLGKPFREATREDLERLLNHFTIEVGEKYGEETKRDFKITLKKFYKISQGNGEFYPENVRWIRLGIHKRNLEKIPESMLTEQEIDKMIESASSLMLKAYISVAWEAGLRIFEQLSMRINSLQFDEDLVSIKVYGKTGYRELFLVDSHPYLAAWIQSHPHKDDPESLLWLRPHSRGHTSFSEAWILQKMKETAELAGIKNKPITQQHIRRSRATHLSQEPGFNQSILEQQMGWAVGSKVARHYIFRSKTQLKEAIKRIHGIETTKETPEKTLKKCDRCQNLIPSRLDTCPICFTPTKVAFGNKVMNRAILRVDVKTILKEIVKEILKEEKDNETRPEHVSQ